MEVVKQPAQPDRAECASLPGAALRLDSRHQRLPQQHQRPLRPMKHDLRLEPQDAAARLSELAVAPSIGAHPRRVPVVAAVDLDDEPQSGCEEVDDAVGHDGLALESDAKLAAIEQLPQLPFGSTGTLPHARCEGAEALLLRGLVM